MATGFDNENEISALMMNNLLMDVPKMQRDDFDAILQCNQKFMGQKFTFRYYPEYFLFLIKDISYQSKWLAGAVVVSPDYITK